MDRVSRETRSRIMSAIRSKWTGPERAFHNLMKGLRVRHRMHPDLPGRPDAVVAGRVAVFVHGCFWHGCPRHYRCPKTRRAFWAEKISRNKARDRRSARRLRRMGFRVAVVWECRPSSAYSLAAAALRSGTGWPASTKGSRSSGTTMRPRRSGPTSRASRSTTATSRG